MRRLSVLIGLLLAMVMVGAILVAGEASSQSQKKSQKANLQSTESEVRRSVFSGNELRLGVHWSVNPDCTTQLVDARIAKGPSNGEIVFKETKAVIELSRNSPRAHCNGRSATGVGLFYTSRDEFAGQEKFMIDIDYKTGLVHRFNYVVDVR
jgi:hypothetical protein